MRRLVSVHMDNPAYWSFEDWDWSEQGKSYVLGELARLTGHRRARLFDGRWKAGEGTVYPEFDEARHVVRPFNLPANWPVYVGYDPGYDHPTAVLWIAVAPNECLYVIDEIYRGGLSVQQHAQEIRRRNAGRTVRRYYGDPQHMFNCTAQSPKSIATQLRECGISFSPWPRSTDVESMVNAVRQRLNDRKLTVFDTCANTIREFQSWSYKRTAKGELPPGDDAFVDADNHAMDVIKGVVAARPLYKQQTVKVFQSR